MAALLSAAAASSARADEANAFNFGVNYSVLWDANVFRLADDAVATRPRNDVVRTTGVTGTFDKTISRQRLHADFGLRDARYEALSFLDNQPYNAAASWSWALGHNLTGLLSHTVSRSSSNYAALQAQIRNIYTTTTDRASLRYEIHPDWFVEVASMANDSEQSVVTTSNLRLRQEEAALLFVRPGGNRLGLRWTTRRGDYPNQTAGINYSYEERQWDGDWAWIPTGASSLSGSLGRLQRRNPYVPQRDFGGLVGRVAWGWTPSGKLTTTVSAQRSLGSNQDILSTFSLTDTLSVAPAWTVTEKIRLQLNLARARSNFRGDSGVVVAGAQPRREDHLSTASIGASYQAMRHLSLSAQVASDRRTSNYTGISYRDHTASVSANWMLW